MTEFLKNDPIALRYCLLYEFLQGKTIEDSFTDFCAAVGEDFFSKEEIYSHFRQFNRGLFQVGVKPVADMRNILCNNKKALRVCVMYEWLSSKKWTVSAKYEKFCETVGKYEMAYRDFHFWFHRFVNGEFDLNYKDEKIYKLMDMPIDIMRNIVEYLDIVDRLSLEKTSVNLRLFSQDQKLFHNFLAFNVFDDSASIGFRRESYVWYENQGNDCTMVFGEKKKVLRGVSYRKQAFQVLKKILENPKLHLDYFSIWNSCKDPNSSEEHFEDALKFTHLLHVKQISLHVKSTKALLNMLLSLKPGYLTKINIDVNSVEAMIEEIVEMEQWKQAKYLDMCLNRFVGPLRHLYHFKEFATKYEALLTEDVREIKEILLKSPDFEKCHLLFGNPVDLIIIRQEFGGPIEGINEIWHYPIPDSTDYFEILFINSLMKIERKKK